jgi:hypothetical protein
MSVNYFVPPQQAIRRIKKLNLQHQLCSVNYCFYGFGLAAARKISGFAGKLFYLSYFY